MFTCGQVPYSGLPVLRLFNTLSSGERLEKPINSACTDEMLDKSFFPELVLSSSFLRFTMIQACWNGIPEHRPTFSTIVEQITTVLGREAGYISFSV